MHEELPVLGRQWGAARHDDAILAALRTSLYVYSVSRKTYSLLGVIPY